LRYGAEQQKLAVKTGAWPLYRFDPRRVDRSQPPLQLDSGEPKLPLSHYMRNETRFRMVEKIDPGRHKLLAAAAQQVVTRRAAIYQQLARLTIPPSADATTAGSRPAAEQEEGV
jgi:pyruvate-ferredoxin/flavodoxin oxidoreductase